MDKFPHREGCLGRKQLGDIGIPRGGASPSGTSTVKNAHSRKADPKARLLPRTQALIEPTGQQP